MGIAADQTVWRSYDLLDWIFGPTGVELLLALERRILIGVVEVHECSALLCSNAELKSIERLVRYSV